MDNNNPQFEMTEEEIKASNRREILLKVKSIMANIAPAIIKFFSTIIYYSIKLIKAFVSESVRMIMGKEL